MDFVASALSPSVICSACLTLAATTAWRWLIDWRQARAIGITVSEFRLGNLRRLFVIAKNRKRQRGGVVGSSGVAWPRVEPKILPERVQSEPVVDVVGVQDFGIRVPVLSLGPTTVQHRIKPLTAEPLKHATQADPIPKNLAESCESKAKSPEQFTRLYLAPKEQIAEFLSAEVARHRGGRGKGSELRRDQGAWCEAYRLWAATNAIGPVLPPCMFLKELNRADAITKSRPRRKDAFGRVLKTPGGTPERDTVYHLSLSAHEAADRAKHRAAAKRAAKCEEPQQFSIAA